MPYITDIRKDGFITWKCIIFGHDYEEVMMVLGFGPKKGHLMKQCKRCDLVKIEKKAK